MIYGKVMIKNIFLKKVKPTSTQLIFGNLAIQYCHRAINKVALNIQILSRIKTVKVTSKRSLQLLNVISHCESYIGSKVYIQLAIGQ